MVRKKGTTKSVGAKKSNVVDLDFTGVETSSRVPDGDYLVKVNKAEIKDKEGENTQFIQFGLTITEGTHAGKSVRHINSLKPNALFALRNTLEALNYPIPEGAFKLDLEAIVGLEMAVSIENEEYNGKDQSRVVDVYTTDDYEAEEGDEDPDEDEPEVDAGNDDADEPEDADEDAGSDDADADEDEELEDYTEEELNAMDEEELLEAADEYEVKPVYKGRGTKKKLDTAATIEAILEVIEEDDEE